MKGYTLGQMMRGVPQQKAAADAMQAELMNTLTAGKIAAQPLEMEALRTDIDLAPLIAAAKQAAAMRPIAVGAGGLADFTGKTLLQAGKPPTEPSAKATRELGTIDGRLVRSDPYSQKTYFEDTKETVGDLTRLVPVGGPTISYIPNQAGNVFGFPTRGPDAGVGKPAVIETGPAPAPADSNSPTAPMIKGTAAANQAAKEIRMLEDAKATFTTLKEDFNALVESGNVGLVPGTVATVSNWATGGEAYPDVEAYGDLADAFTARLKSLTGDVGVLTEKDYARIRAALGSVKRDPSVAKIKFKVIDEIIDGSIQRRSKIAPPTGEDIITEPTETSTISDDWEIIE